LAASASIRWKSPQLSTDRIAVFEQNKGRGVGQKWATAGERIRGRGKRSGWRKKGEGKERGSWSLEMHFCIRRFCPHATVD